MGAYTELEPRAPRRRLAAIALACVGVAAVAAARASGSARSAAAALATRQTCALCDGLEDKACLFLLDAKVDGMDDLDRLGFEKRVLGAGICDQESLGSAMCLIFLDKKIASMKNSERLQTWELACAYDMFGPSEPPANSTAFDGANVKPDFSKHSEGVQNTTALRKKTSSSTTVRRYSSDNSTHTALKNDTLQGIDMLARADTTPGDDSGPCDPTVAECGDDTAADDLAEKNDDSCGEGGC